MSTVTVACKIPNGLHLDVRDKPTDPPTRVTVIGSAQARRMESEGNLVTDTALVAGGYGLTRDVDASFWDAWLANNKDSKIVKEGMIFATPKLETSRDTGKGMAEIKTGLEPLDPNKMPRNLEKATK